MYYTFSQCLMFGDHGEIEGARSPVATNADSDYFAALRTQAQTSS